MPVGLSDSFFVPCIPTKTVNLGNGNFREFFRWRGEFCHFKTGIPGGPGMNRNKEWNNNSLDCLNCWTTYQRSGFLYVIYLADCLWNAAQLSCSVNENTSTAEVLFWCNSNNAAGFVKCDNKKMWLNNYCSLLLGTPVREQGFLPRCPVWQICIVLLLCQQIDLIW